MPEPRTLARGSAPVLVSRGFGGFTLVELLVVIAIIALLIAILLPSLAKARDRAITVSCLTRERQIYYYAITYQNEQKSYYPACHFYDGPAAAGDPPAAFSLMSFTRALELYIPGGTATTTTYNTNPSKSILIDPGTKYVYSTPVNVAANVWPHLYAGDGRIVGYNTTMQFGGGNMRSWTTPAQIERYYPKRQVKSASIFMIGEIAGSSPYLAYTHQLYTKYNHNDGKTTNVMMSDGSGKTFDKTLTEAVADGSLRIW